MSLTLTLEPLKREDLDDFIKVSWAAFEPLEANMIYPMLYPNGLQPDVMERMRYRLLGQTNGDLSSWCYCAKDITTNEIAGISWWAVNEHPPKTQEEIDAQFEKAWKTRSGGPPVPGMNRVLDQAYFTAAFRTEMEVVDGRPYMSLMMLATSPKYQRRGAGSLLLKAGLDKADKLGLPVCLCSGVCGRPLYERFGFQVVRDLPLNCLDYGGRSDGRHWAMIRPARAIEQGTNTNISAV